MIRVLLADDQALVRGGFRSILEGQPDMEVVGEAADGAEAVELALSSRPDVVVMDIRMPRLDGIAATRTLLERHSSPARVLVLTTFNQEGYVYDALRAGASGFLLKSAPPRELAGAIRTVAAGDALLAPEITRAMIQDYVARPRPGAATSERLAVLTPREHEVLTLAISGMLNKQIAAELGVSEITVKVHRRRVMEKMQVRSVAELVRAVERLTNSQPAE